MAEVKPFKGIRPSREAAAQIASLPYDVYNRAEAKEIVGIEPLSFLSIDRPETMFDEDFDMYSFEAYAAGKDLLHQRIRDGHFGKDEQACYYLYVLTRNGHTQRGIVAVASIDDYLDAVIKKHENTRPDKEIDRTRHVDILNAQTGPIFMAYHTTYTLDHVMTDTMKQDPLYDFIKDDDTRHQVWMIEDQQMIHTITEGFAQVESIYIADGHHRAQAACNVALERRMLDPKYTGMEEYNYFLSVLFPADELIIMDYNRVIHDLNGLSHHEYFDLVKQEFHIEGPFIEEQHPTHKGQWGMYIGKSWYLLTAREGSIAYSMLHSTLNTNEPRGHALDVSVLQERILSPILGIDDPKTNDRIQFVGGIRGLQELEKLVNQTDGVAFAMYPTSMDELFMVSDAGELMPPKSTWFEPKLLSGLFIHELS